MCHTGKLNIDAGFILILDSFCLECDFVCLQILYVVS